MQSPGRYSVRCNGGMRVRGDSATNSLDGLNRSSLFLKDVVFSSVKWVHPYTDPKLSKSNNTLIFFIPFPVAASAVFLHPE